MQTAIAARPAFGCFIYVTPNEGELREFTEEQVALVEESLLSEPIFQSADLYRVVHEAIMRKVKVDPAFFQYQMVRYEFFHFRPDQGFMEEDGTSYQVFQVPLYRPGGFDYAYIVIVRQRGVYRLQGVSKALPIAAPENGWCNQPDSWVYWCDEV